jgi:large subunit ribosomal protein L23
MPELHPYDVILRPVITEKVNRLVAEHNQVVFEVARRANKQQIKQAVEIVFGIEPMNILDVRTMNMPAKRGRRGRKVYIRQRAWKKAIIALGPDASIPLFNV